MNKIHNLLLAAALVSAFAWPGAAESLSLSDLENAQDAQMVEMDPQSIWTYPIPYDLLMTSDYIVLANKENLLDETYIPADLVKLTCRKISSDPIQMREVAAQALSDMFDAAKADGVTIYAHSGYRSYRTQNTMYSNRLKKNNGKDRQNISHNRYLPVLMPAVTAICLPEVLRHACQPRPPSVFYLCSCQFSSHTTDISFCS